MFDARLRPLIDPPLAALAQLVVKAGLSANQITLIGFAFGLAAVPALATQNYGLALALILANRLADGLDGAVARLKGLTDFGGFLDISLDFIVYAGIVFGATLARPDDWIYGAFLLWSYTGPMVTFLAYAIIAAKHGLTTEIRGAKSLYYLGGLAEGTETLVVSVLFCLRPDWFPWLCAIYGTLCWITAASRVWAGRQAFGAASGGAASGGAGAPDAGSGTRGEENAAGE